MRKMTPLSERRVEKIVLAVTPKELERMNEKTRTEGISRSILLRKALKESYPGLLND